MIYLDGCERPASIRQEKVKTAPPGPPPKLTWAGGPDQGISRGLNVTQEFGFSTACRASTRKKKSAIFENFLSALIRDENHPRDES
ncbi:hypothetical protein RUM43_008654 [Polyplax serrata]|uniref:Uncharacterized protein n=1 Tax=Polyplax serrata TaxID=468196 RepID=A0AAN8NNR1_POLSC